MPKYLCMVIQSSNNKEIVSYEREYPDGILFVEGMARYDAEITFKNLQEYSKSAREIGLNWHVETCEI